MSLCKRERGAKVNLIDQPLELQSGVILKNRLFMAPLTTNSATETGGISDEEALFFTKRAEGFGGVIIGSHSVSSDGDGFSNSWNIYRRENFKSLRRLVNTLQSSGAKVFLQLYHAGRLALPDFIEGAQAISPSRIPAERGMLSYPKPMTQTDIQQMIGAFQRGTLRAIELGFDGVELHGANTYLIQQFFSPHSNRRTDKWGGSLDKRMCFAKELIEACLAVIKQYAVTKPFGLGYRFSPEEYETPGIRVEHTLEFVDEISQLPLDYLHVSLNHYEKTSIFDGKEILPRVQAQINAKMPLIASGGIMTQQDVNKVMRQYPLLSVGNASLLNLDWAEKIVRKSGKIRCKIHISEQQSLYMPDNLWQMLLCMPNLFEAKFSN